MYSLSILSLVSSASAFALLVQDVYPIKGHYAYDNIPLGVEQSDGSLYATFHPSSGDVNADDVFISGDGKILSVNGDSVSQNADGFFVASGRPYDAIWSIEEDSRLAVNGETNFFVCEGNPAHSPIGLSQDSSECNGFTRVYIHAANN